MGTASIPCRCPAEYLSQADALDGTGGEPFSFPAFVLLDAHEEVQTCRVPLCRAFLSAL